MRIAIALVLLLAACGQPASAPATSPGDATAGASGVGRIAEQEFESEALVGVWSFDRSCASGDGMRLDADGTASFDEWGGGTWSLGDDNTVVLTLARNEPGIGPTGETVIYTLAIAANVTDDLIGQFTSVDGPRGINAKRCLE